MKALLVSLALTLPSLAQAAAPTAYCGFEGRPNETTLRASVGEVVAVVAAGNPTTGYRWASLDGVRSTFHPDGDHIGGGGAYVFTKTVTQADFEKPFTFVYSRAWETDKPVKTCTVMLKPGLSDEILAELRRMKKLLEDLEIPAPRRAPAPDEDNAAEQALRNLDCARSLDKVNCGR